MKKITLPQGRYHICDPEEFMGPAGLALHWIKTSFGLKANTYNRAPCMFFRSAVGPGWFSCMGLGELHTESGLIFVGKLRPDQAEAVEFGIQFEVTEPGFEVTEAFGRLEIGGWLLETNYDLSWSLEE